MLGPGAWPESIELLRRAAPLVQERITVLSEARDMLAFLFVADDDLVVADDALPAPADGIPVLDGALAILPSVADWDAAVIEWALRAELIERQGLKPKTAFGPLRTAITGRRISPPLFESMELLGRESTLTRIAALRAVL